MSNRERILKRAERRSQSLYGGARTAHKPSEMQELLNDETLPLSLKFTAILAAYAYLPCPCDFSCFRKLIPEDFWELHFRVGYINYGQGPYAAYVEHELGEMNYTLGIGNKQSRYGLHGLEFISDKSFLPKEGGLSSGYLDLPLDAPVYRFALYHPFLQYELHDRDGIYIFNNGA